MVTRDTFTISQLSSGRRGCEVGGFGIGWNTAPPVASFHVPLSFAGLCDGWSSRCRLRILLQKTCEPRDIILKRTGPATPQHLAVAHHVQALGSCLVIILKGVMDAVHYNV